MTRSRTIYMKQPFAWTAAAVAAASLLAASGLTAQSLAPKNEKGVAVGALAPEAIAKPRPKPAFDITGTWLHGGGQNNPWQFSPPPNFKLTPWAQVQYDA